jgi:2-polyprenyl-3-methyl-5-hydroxy-6-metoxy-1,4-benzoquinol methylase
MTMSTNASGTPPEHRKPSRYFEGARQDFVDALPLDSKASILELGCANGGTGASALASGKCGRYVGIEISDAAAAVARPRLSQVIVGDVEKLDLPWDEATFDALIMSEVLEHLVDPWTVVPRLVNLVKPGGMVMASSPNVSHYRIILELIAGRWELKDSGVMDRTHLRWFTPASFREMFEGAGVSVTRLAAVAPPGPRARVIGALSGGLLDHLLIRQINLFGFRR